MDVQIIVAFLSLAGIGLGALLSGIGYALKIRSERLSAKRLVLFYLLEIRAAVLTEYVTARRLTAIYLQICNAFWEKKGVSDIAGPLESIKDLVETHFSRLLGSIKPNLDHGFLERYEQALMNLAQNDPVLAYRLRGREGLVAATKAQQDYISTFSASDSLLALGQLQKPLATIIDNKHEEAAAGVLELIDRDIRKTAWGCGVWCCFSVRKPLSIGLKESLEMGELGIESELEGLAQEVQRLAQERISEGTSLKAEGV